MYRLFLNPILRLSNSNITTRDTLIKNMLANHKSALDYYRSFSTYVNNDSFLITLLTSLSGYLDEKDTYRIVNDNLDDIHLSNQITSPYCHGIIHSTGLYTSNCIIIANDYGLPDSYSRWEDIRAVRCLSHPYTDAVYCLPPTGIYITHTGLSVLGIDVPLLTHQFSMWIKDKVDNSTSPESMAKFVSCYVLPNMMQEQVDIAIRNKLVFYFNNTLDMPKAPLLTGKPTTSFTKEINKMLIKAVAKINTDSKINYADALVQVPMIHAENYLNAVPILNVGLDPNCYWVVLLLYCEWTYPMLFFINNDQKTHGCLKTILQKSKRYTDNISALEHVSSVVLKEFNRKLNEIEKKYM